LRNEKALGLTTRTTTRTTFAALGDPFPGPKCGYIVFSKLDRIVLL